MREFTYINILGLPIMSEIPYRGLYRFNFGEWDIDIEKHPDVRLLFAQGKESANIPFNDENLNQSVLFRDLLNNKSICDITVCTNQNLQSVRLNFIGFDICSNSLFYSPLGSGGVYGKEPYLKKFMSKSLYEMVQNDINCYGLLTTKSIADEFSRFCTQNASLIESEKDWFPVSIFIYNE